MPEFIAIPEGMYRIGAKVEDAMAAFYEMPDTVIKLPEFSIAAKPITLAEWRDFCIASGYMGAGDNYLNHLRGVDPQEWDFNKPVTWISRADAEAYCNYYKYQLPTEAQWEIAAHHLPDNGLGLWQWCADMWDADWLVYLNQGEMPVNPVKKFPSPDKMELKDIYFSQFGTARGCGQKWVRFDKEKRFPFSPAIYRRAQTHVLTRTPFLGFRPVSISTSVLGPWQQETEGGLFQ